MNGFRIVDFTGNDGTHISFDKNSIFVITGPNNCGKSRLLKDIFYISESKIVLNNINLDFVGEIDTALNESIQTPIGKSNEQAIIGNYVAYGKNIYSLLQSFGGNFQLRNIVLQSLMRYVTTINRLTALQTTPSEDPTVPFNMFALPAQLKNLYEDKNFENIFYDKVSSAFGKGVMLDKYTFQSNRLHFISRDDVNNRNDFGTAQFSSWFRSQQTLDQQGDGVRSFCSVLLTVMADTKPLILIDEPEAFLHPPQIRRLAREIANSAPPDTQIVISTHSTEFLQGLIDFAPDRTSVVRLTRQVANSIEINKIHKLNSEDISKFWKDALLKTSDVFSSLFHDVAVIVEGDSDARFFRALLDQNSSITKNSNLDIRFYHCGGKQRIYKIVNSLKVIGVPVIAIVDIDILNDRRVFFDLFDACGDSDEEAKQIFEFIRRYVSEQKSTRNKGDAKTDIDNLLKDLDDRKPIPAHIVGKISEALEASSAWRLIKRSGQEFFTRGEPFNKFSRLVEICKNRGLLINTLGELENFDKTIEARKDEWLGEVYKKDLSTDPNIEKARIFMTDLINHASFINRTS